MVLDTEIANTREREYDEELRIQRRKPPRSDRTTGLHGTGKDGKACSKYANVYLSYGYDEHTDTRYDILYLMHGGGGNPDAWLDCCRIKNLLDARIDEGAMRPLIVVFPTFYRKPPVRGDRPDAAYEFVRVCEFADEVDSVLLPAVEGYYRTYASDTTAEVLTAWKAHRAFGGFSMGGATTWLMFTEKKRYFRDFLPLSGDCWNIEPMGGRTRTEETARFLCNAATAEHDHRLFCATGTDDIACGAMVPMLEAMKAYTDVFDFSDDPAAGNLHFHLEPGYPHTYESVLDYLDLYLPYLFGE